MRRLIDAHALIWAVDDPSMIHRGSILLIAAWLAGLLALPNAQAQEHDIVVRGGTI